MLTTFHTLYGSKRCLYLALQMIVIPQPHFLSEGTKPKGIPHMENHHLQLAKSLHTSIAIFNCKLLTEGIHNSAMMDHRYPFLILWTPRG